MKRSLLFITLLIIPLVSFSQETDQIAIEKPKSAFRSGIDQIVDYIEKNELSGVDTSYIGAPKKRWSIFTNTYLADVHLKLQSKNLEFDLDDGDYFNLDKVVINLRSKLQNQLSFGDYFMGYGLSYSWDVNKHYNKDLSFTMYSSPIGGEFRFHSTKALTGSLYIKSDGEEGKTSFSTNSMKVESFILNAYYVFNSKKFSYNAAMSYSKYQKKSAGSIIAGLTLFQNRLSLMMPKDIDSNPGQAIESFLFALCLGGIDKIQLRQGAIGAGYAYNWVPYKGWTIHASVLPMLLITTKSVTKLSGEWSEEEKDLQMRFFGGNTHVSYTYMLRSSISYYPNDRFIFGISGFFNHFRVGHKKTYFMTTDDWIVRAFIGVRF